MKEASNTKVTANNKIIKGIAALWVVWAIFHIFPGIIAMVFAINGDISSIEMLEPASQADMLAADYPAAVSAILAQLGQHAFNLFWFGIVAFVCAVYIWRFGSQTAMLIAALVAGFADLGVIFFIDIIGGYTSVFGSLIVAVGFLAIGLSVYTFKRPALG